MHLTTSVVFLQLLMLQAIALDYRWMKKSLRDGLTSEEKKFLLDVHNFYRRAVTKGGVIGNGPPAANMRELTWNDELAADAQAWSANCGGPMHNGARERHYSGQNTMLHSDRANILKEAMIAWGDQEAPLYNYGSTDYLQRGAGHYTQMIWARSDELGCGFSMCNGHSYGRLICDFMLAGNFDKYSVYEGSTPCTKCDPGFGFCHDNLCAKSCSGGNCRCLVDASTCKRNGGKFNRQKCYCDCPASKMGLNCEKKCEDTPNVWCTSDNMCNKGDQFYNQGESFCPKTCKKCNAAGSSPSTSNCTDDNSNCATWASVGECSRNPGYMLRSCKKSCRQC